MMVQPGSASPRTLQAIWIGFLAAPIAYLVVGWIAARDLVATGFPQPFTPILILLGLGSVVLGNVLPARMAAARQSPDATLQERLARYQTFMIIRWACFEAPSILGLVLLFLSGQTMVLVIGCGISLALVAQARPDLTAYTDRSP